MTKSLVFPLGKDTDTPLKQDLGLLETEKCLQRLKEEKKNPISHACYTLDQSACKHDKSSLGRC